MKRCSESLVIRGNRNQNHKMYFTPTRMAASTRQMISGLRKLQRRGLHTAGRECREPFGSPSQVTQALAVSFLRLCPRSGKRFFTSRYHALWDVHTEICMQVFIVTLFTIAKNGNHDCAHHLMNAYRKCGEEWEEGRSSAHPSNNGASLPSITLVEEAPP